MNGPDNSALMFYPTVSQHNSGIIIQIDDFNADENHHSCRPPKCKKEFVDYVNKDETNSCGDVVRILVLAALNQTSVLSLVWAKFSVVKCSKTVMW